MRALILREFESMVFSKREALRVYTIIGIGGILMMWLLGPHVFNVVSTEQSYILIATLGLVIAFGRLTISMERDETNRQQTFLQTLPTLKSNIVHAKFISFLLLSTFTLVWIAILFCFNMFVNGGKVEYWMAGVLFVSMFIFVTAMTLLWYYFWGNHRLNMVFYILLGVWVAIFAFLGFILRLFLEFSFAKIIGLALVTSVLIYFVCWRVAVKRVGRKGIPQEEAQTEETVAILTDK
ncbi:ABC-2 transporter permease [Lentibacillus sp. N15]|uniref:ABC-2 transporter permease n=1 Tax=Lentibacillus songyuanensis TaxID=3136161 RepID=UPI0031BA39FF